ncbi:AAA-like domain-containing protein [Dapis sp. BLCC M229]|uniref:WD40 domain-containing protein n=1 Tax=Dapis sp. BLCC M229 TaxID=3400188 RepID=UPI003CE89BB1
MNNYEYYIGGSLPIHATTYVNRQADNDLYQGLKNGDFCYVLNSRQMGKSSLRVKTIQRLQQENIACVTIDMTEIGTHDITPSEWYASIIDTILTGLNLDDDFDIEELWEANSQLSHVKRFSKFIGEILLPSISQNIVIFIDEIDSTLSLPFNIDDFFAVVRDCYNKRADNSDYQRLTFVMIGVATPADLIKEKKRTPFNIGRPIKLTGFRLAEVEPLAKGLVDQTTNTNKLMEAVLDWTGGQPFLTQKVCKLISNSPEIVPDGQEAEWVADLVRQRIIENWQVHDDPEHLKTIRDRLLVNEKRASRLLGLYQQILIPLPSPLERGRPEEIPLPSPLERGRPEKQKPPLSKGGLGGILTDDTPEPEEVSDAQPQSSSLPLPSPLEKGKPEEIPLERGRPEKQKPPLSKGGLGGILTDDTPDQMELRLTGLVVKQEGRLQVANRIYQEVFNLQWVEKELGKLRPYSEAFTAWEESGCKDESRLLRGQALADALAWSVDKSLSNQDYQFLAAAQEVEKQAIELEKLEAQIKLDAQLKANQILEEAKQIADLKLAEAEAVGKSITSKLLSNSGKYFEGLLEALRAARQLPPPSQIFQPQADSKMQIIDALSQAIYIDDGKYRELNRLQGHEDRVFDVAFSPDGETLATASRDNTVKLWNRQGKLLQTLEGHEDRVFDVAFSPNGETLATASWDNTVKLWNQQGQFLQTLTGHEYWVYGVAFSPDGQMIASASDDQTVKLWNQEGELLQTLVGHENWVLDVAFSPDGETLATASSDKTVKLWNQQGELLQTLVGHEDRVYGVGFSPDGETIATASRDKTVKLWNQEGKLLQTLTGHEDTVYGVGFSPDGETIATASSDKTVKLWNRQGKLLQILTSHENWVWGVTFSPDGKTIATASADKTVKLWNRQGKLLQTLTDHEDAVFGVGFSPDRETIATASSDKTVKLWNRQGKLLQTLRGHNNSVWGLAFSPDGETIATASSDKTVKLWNQQGKLLQTLRGHNNSVYSVVFSPDGETIATASADKTAKLWNQQGKLLQTLRGHNNSVYSVVFSPDGETIATASADKTVKLWNQEGKLLQTLVGHENSVFGVVFSPDGETIASVSGDKTVKLWNQEGQLLQILQGHENSVFGVAFSPDGETIATASSDKTVKLWNIWKFDRLHEWGCNWVRDYLENNPNVSESDKHLCDGIGE